MKSRSLVLLFLILATGTTSAQRQLRIGYIDMDYILDNMSSYKQANQQLDKKIQKWSSEIATKKKKIDQLKDELENERPLLTKDLIQERQDEIDYREQKLQDYQQKRFGPQGDIVAQRREIIQPIQDEVFNAVQEIGKKREYDFIFDSSSDALMLFSANRHDISDQVLANITRNSKKIARSKEKDKRSKELDKDEPIYKSVEKARLDKEEKEEREAEKKRKKEKRQAQLDERQAERDSIRQARKESYKKRQQKIKEQRQRQRDSIKQAREDMIKERKRRRDSVHRAREKKRKNRH